MSGINKIFLIGHLGSDPERKYFQDGTAVSSFSLATSDEWKDKDTGEKKRKTEWHRIVAYRKLAEICNEYLKKGKQVYIEGKIRNRKWEKDGVTKYQIEIEAENMVMLGTKETTTAESQFISNPIQEPNYSLMEDPPF